MMKHSLSLILVYFLSKSAFAAFEDDMAFLEESLRLVDGGVVFRSDDFEQRPEEGNDVTYDLVTAFDRHLIQQKTGDFDRICEALRPIFRDQCSCGPVENSSPQGDREPEYAAEGSGTTHLVNCHYNGIQANAAGLLGEGNSAFQMTSLKVCKNHVESDHQACTTIHYSNNVGVHCEVTFGDRHKELVVGGADESAGPDEAGGDSDYYHSHCQSCSFCQTEDGLVGLEVDCENLAPHLSTDNCMTSGTTSGAADEGDGDFDSLRAGSSPHGPNRARTVAIPVAIVAVTLLVMYAVARA